MTLIISMLESSTRSARRECASLIDVLQMMLCVNMAAGMGAGKKCAQCGHAAVGAWRTAQGIIRSGGSDAGQQMRCSLLLYSAADIVLYAVAMRSGGGRGEVR